MTINPKLKSLLKKSKLDENKALLYLMSLHFGIPTETTFEIEFANSVNSLGIVNLDYKGTTKVLNWVVPVFEGLETEWSWVEDWRKLFHRINPDRAGRLQDCIVRMKKFFAENPTYRSSDVIEATKEYIKTVKDPTFLKTTQKFIKEGSGATATSHLAFWCERLKEQKERGTSNSDKIKRQMAQ